MNPTVLLATSLWFAALALSEAVSLHAEVLWTGGEPALANQVKKAEFSSGDFIAKFNDPSAGWTRDQRANCANGDAWSRPRPASRSAGATGVPIPARDCHRVPGSRGSRWLGLFSRPEARPVGTGLHGHADCGNMGPG